jgi:hypothetical protein
MPTPRLHDDYIISDDRGYPRPRPQPPASYPLPHPDHTVKQLQQKRLQSYHARNHGQFRERNRGSKKAGFLGMLKLVLKCGCFASDVAEQAGNIAT